MLTEKYKAYNGAEADVKAVENHKTALKSSMCNKKKKEKEKEKKKTDKPKT